MTTKITNKELFTALLELDEVKANPIWIEKIISLIDGIDRKNANRKPTAQQVENEHFKEVILSVMTEGTGYTVSQIIKLCAAEGVDFKSNQQCTALMRQLRLEGLVTRLEDKKASLYFKAGGEA